MMSTSDWPDWTFDPLATVPSSTGDSSRPSEYDLIGLDFSFPPSQPIKSEANREPPPPLPATSSSSSVSSSLATSLPPPSYPPPILNTQEMTPVKSATPLASSNGTNSKSSLNGNNIKMNGFTPSDGTCVTNLISRESQTHRSFFTVQRSSSTKRTAAPAAPTQQQPRVSSAIPNLHPQSSQSTSSPVPKTNGCQSFETATSTKSHENGALHPSGAHTLRHPYKLRPAPRPPVRNPGPVDPIHKSVSASVPKDSRIASVMSNEMPYCSAMHDVRKSATSATLCRPKSVNDRDCGSFGKAYQIEASNAPCRMESPYMEIERFDSVGTCSRERRTSGTSDSTSDMDNTDRYETLPVPQHSTVADPELERKIEFWYAAFPFTAMGSNQLTVKAGQVVRILQKHDMKMNSDWWLAQDRYGNRGFVPAAYLSPYDRPH